ncbi:MAG: hypothetical protein QW292_03935 [Candidatus Parvarchaeota archaeon]
MFVKVGMNAKSEGCSIPRRVTVICPSYSKGAVGADVNNARNAAKILQQAGFSVTLPELPVNESPLGIYNSYIKTIFSRTFIKSIFNAQGIVYTFFLPVTFVTGILKKVFGVKFLLIAFVAGAPLDSVWLKLYIPLLIATSRLCDGVVFHKYAWTLRFAKYSNKFTVVSGIVIDEQKLVSKRSDAQGWRVVNKLTDKMLVGVIGPFRGKNNSTLNFVLDNMGRFDPRIVFIMIGEFDSRRFHSNERMKFIGKVEDMVDSLRLVDCLLIVREFRTGAPMSKMVYAMGAGLCVVTNETEGLPVNNWEHAIVCRTGGIVATLNYLVNNQSELHRIGKNALEFARKEFNSKIENAKLSEFFADLWQDIGNYK